MLKKHHEYHQLVANPANKMAGRSEAPLPYADDNISKKADEPTKRKIIDASSEDSETEMQTDDFTPCKNKKRNTKTKPPTEPEPRSCLYAVPVSNRWGALAQITEEKTPQQPEVTQSNPSKKQWIPPIIIAGALGDYKMMCETIKKVLGNDNFRIYANTKETKINVFIEEDRTKLLNGLKADKVPCHSYALRSERTKKIVLKAAPNMNVQEIKEELTERGIQIKNCTKLKSKNPYSFSYLVTMDINENLNNVKKVTNVGYCKAKWETFNKSKRYTQCFRCQQFGHGALYCNYEYKCVKCGQSHPTAECTLKRDDKPKCANCKGEHPANYGRCPALEDYLNKKLESAKNKARQNSTPRVFSSKHVTPGLAYNRATQNQTEKPEDNYQPSGPQKTDTNELQQLSKVMSEISEMCNIKQMLQLLAEASTRLKSCKSNIEKMLVIAELCENLDG